MHLHQAPVGFLAQGGVLRPAGGGGDGLTDFTAFQLEHAEALANQVHAATPGFTLCFHPHVEVRRVVQREALEEIAAVRLGSGPQCSEHVRACVVIEIVRPRVGASQGVGRL